ncbi:hypothetical protein B0H17DRAFT_969978, partial [Mycena rosella]
NFVMERFCNSLVLAVNSRKYLFTSLAHRTRDVAQPNQSSHYGASLSNGAPHSGRLMEQRTEPFKFHLPSNQALCRFDPRGLPLSIGTRFFLSERHGEAAWVRLPELLECGDFDQIFGFNRIPTF